MPPSSSPGSLQPLSVDGREVPPPPPPVAVKGAARGGARGGSGGPPATGRGGAFGPAPSPAEPAASGSRPSSLPVAAPFVLSLRLRFTLELGTADAEASRPERWFRQPDTARGRIPKSYNCWEV